MLPLDVKAESLYRVQKDAVEMSVSPKHIAPLEETQTPRKRKKKFIWTEQKDSFILTEKSLGRTTGQIATALHIPTTSVRNRLFDLTRSPMQSKNDKWAASAEALLIEEHRSGKSICRLSWILGVNEKKISNKIQALIKRGLLQRRLRKGPRTNAHRPSSRSWTQEQIEKVKALYTDGKTPPEIAVATGRTLSSINNVIHKQHDVGSIPKRTDAEKSKSLSVAQEKRSTAATATATDKLAALKPGFELGYVVGVLYGDGFLSIGGITRKGGSGTVGLTTTNLSFAEQFAASLSSVWEISVPVNTRTETKSCMGREYKNVTYYKVQVHNRALAYALWQEYGPTGTFDWRVDADTAIKKGVPFCKGLLRGFFDSEGSVSLAPLRGRNDRFQFCMSMTSGNAQGIEDVAKLFKAFGYVFTVTPNGKTKKGSRLRMSALSEIKRFAVDIGSSIDYKNAILSQSLTQMPLYNKEATLPTALHL